jgi:hypothetical protein
MVDGHEKYGYSPASCSEGRGREAAHLVGYIGSTVCRLIVVAVLVAHQVSVVFCV